MEIRFTSKETEISGSPSELRRISLAIARIADGDVLTFEADAAANPSPYDAMLTHLEVIASDGPVKVSIHGTSLQASGHPEMLHPFASFFDFEDESAPGHHHHFDWFEGNDYVSPDSRSLVVAVARVYTHR